MKLVKTKYKEQKKPKEKNIPSSRNWKKRNGVKRNGVKK